MEFDVIVIGSGQAGVPLAARLAESGRQVLICERKLLGGTCVNYGCTPTKTMVASARAAHVARNAARLGVRALDVRVDLAAVVDRKNRIVEQWRAGVEARLKRAGDRLRVVEGHARFVGQREVEIDGHCHRASTVVINTGGRPVVPNVPGLEDVPFLDNKSIMDLRDRPRHLLILGGGYIACEFGQMFRRFGSNVSIIGRNPHLLGREDVDVVESLEEVFRNEEIDLRLGNEPERVVRQGDDLVVSLQDGAELRGSHILVAAGRRPNTDDLACAASGVEVDARGAVRVDEHYKTNADGVYAVGDVIGGPQFTHTAWDDHRILYDILVNGSTRGRSGRLVPYSVFVDPQLARAGLSQREADAAGIDYEVATMPFAHVARAVEVDEPAGIMKVLLDPKTEQVLGAAIVGQEAGELIHIFVTLMQAEAPARVLVEAQAVHPTFAEGVQSLVMRLERYKLK
jgi:pyruvate/2-oxoglutarate dehydrogenase complex dihydrolipoamide dehydrogenase (E3) component